MRAIDSTFKFCKMTLKTSTSEIDTHPPNGEIDLVEQDPLL